MYFKSKLYICLLLVHFPFEAFAKINDGSANTFTVTPNKCIALREGSPCYAPISVNWKQSTVGNYCIRSSDKKQIMQCWTAQKSGVFQYEFNSEKNQKFELINTKTGQVSGRAGIKVHWVYTNKQKKRRWRLF